jgi:hypothetical protein
MLYCFLPEGALMVLFLQKVIVYLLCGPVRRMEILARCLWEDRDRCLVGRLGWVSVNVKKEEGFSLTIWLLRLKIPQAYRTSNASNQTLEDHRLQQSETRRFPFSDNPQDLVA